MFKDIQNILKALDNSILFEAYLRSFDKESSTLTAALPYVNYSGIDSDDKIIDPYRTISVVLNDDTIALALLFIDPVQHEVFMKQAENGCIDPLRLDAFCQALLYKETVFNLDTIDKLTRKQYFWKHDG